MVSVAGDRFDITAVEESPAILAEVDGCGKRVCKGQTAKGTGSRWVGRSSHAAARALRAGMRQVGQMQSGYVQHGRLPSLKWQAGASLRTLRCSSAL